ncbi:hypothetical protein [Novosphingobium sp.]|uniref:hypothetical protein n=1 Tax=Novosphingobium sp. TaxID=1874826 RepID=UPI0038BA887A
MFRTLSAFAVLALAVPADTQAPVNLPARGAAPDPAADLRCAATIAIVAAEQDRGSRRALALPPMANRGRRYFALIGNRLVAATGQSQEQVRDALAAEALAQRKAGAANPDAAMVAAFGRCQPRLDAAIAPLIVPDVAQCAALATLGAADVRASEGDTAAARALDQLGAVLAGRARRLALDAGQTPQQADAGLVATQAALARGIKEGPGDGLDRYDFDHCTALGAAAEKSQN